MLDNSLLYWLNVLCGYFNVESVWCFSSQVVVPPAIDAKSRAMADELLKKQKGGFMGSGHTKLSLIPPPGNDHISLLRKRKIIKIIFKMFFSGDMLVSGSVCLNPESQADFFKIIATPILDDYTREKLTNPLPRHFSRWCSFPQGGIC